MGVALFFACVLATLLASDLWLRFRTFIGRPRDYFAWAYRYQEHVLSRLIAQGRVWLPGRAPRKPEDCPPLPEQFLVIANHQSMADVPVVAEIFPRHNIGYVVKSELRRYIPFISFGLRQGAHAVLSRTAEFGLGQRELVRFARHALAHRVCPVVFPEGTRSRDGRVGAFRTGAVRVLLENAPMPVVVLALDGGRRVSRMRQVIRNASGVRYRARVLALLPCPDGKQEILATVGRAEREISRQIEAWTGAESAGTAGGRSAAEEGRA